MNVLKSYKLDSGVDASLRESFISDVHEKLFASDRLI